jgi:hypothetical protein
MDAPRKWFLRLEEKLVRARCVASFFDPVLLRFRIEEGELEGFISTHVNDLTFPRTDRFN